LTNEAKLVIVVLKYSLHIMKTKKGKSRGFFTGSESGMVQADGQKNLEDGPGVVD